MTIQKTTTDLSTLKINYLTKEMYEDALENDEINDNELYITPGSGSIESTDIPTADEVAEFDSTAHMNSTDMTSSEVEDFVDELDVGGGGFPIKFKLVSRQITQSGGIKDYWTMLTTMPPKTGYTRVPIAYGTSNGALCPVGTLLDASEDAVRVQTYNYSGSSVTATLYCLYLWVRDDMMEL